MVIDAANAAFLTPAAEAQRGWITQVAWSPNGKGLAVSNGEGISLYTVPDLKLAGTLRGHAGPVKGIAVNPDGTIIASASSDTTVRLWDVKRSEAIHVLEAHTNAVNAVSFGPSGKLLASAGADRTLRLWDVSDRDHPRLKDRISGQHTDEITSVIIIEEGEYGLVASGSWDNTLRLWGLAGATKSYSHDDWVREVDFSPAANVFGSASKDGYVRLWELSHEGTEEQSGHFAKIKAHEDGVDCLAFSPDGRLLVTGGRDRLVRCWDVAEALAVGKLGFDSAIVSLENHGKPILTLAFSPDGSLLASGSGDNRVLIWKVTNL